MIKADGSHMFNAKSGIGDTFEIRMKHFVKHNGKYKGNGEVKFNSGIAVPV